ncbi:MAG TPA: ABC transporter permease subunit [Candidatus Saccharimonadales bacterium]
MIPMIRWELRRRRNFTIWWTIGITALIGFTVLTYGSVREQSAELNKAFGDLSSDIGSFVGTTDMFSPVGYLNSQLFFITLPILFIILSATLASGLLGKEENNRTLEVLLSRPISRTKLLAAKGFSGMTILLTIGLLATLVTIACSYAVSMDISAVNLLIAGLAAALFSGAFGAISFMLYAASLATRRLAMLAAIVLSLGSYLITSLSGMVDWLETPAKFLPYHYYDPNTFLNGNIPSGFIWYTAGIYVVSAVIAVIGFRRRDIA